MIEVEFLKVYVDHLKLDSHGMPELTLHLIYVIKQNLQ